MHLTFEVTGVAECLASVRRAGDLPSSLKAKNAVGHGVKKKVVSHLLALGPLLPRSPLEAGDVVYWVVKQVTQDRDPGVLPIEQGIAFFVEAFLAGAASCREMEYRAASDAAFAAPSVASETFRAEWLSLIDFWLTSKPRSEARDAQW